VGKGDPATSQILTPGATQDPQVTGSFARHTAVMSVGTGLSRASGYVRLAVTAAALGQVAVGANAYYVANNTPNIIYELILGGILTSVVVPVFVERMARRSVHEAWDSARAMLSVALVVLTGVVVVTILAAPLIVDLYTVAAKEGPGREAERRLATFFLRWFMPQMVVYAIGAIATALLNAHRRFAAPMFAPILNNLTVIVTMVVVMLLPSAGPGDPDGLTTAQAYVLAIGTTLGVVAMTLALLPSLRATGFRFRWRSGWSDPAVRRIARLSLWVFVYVLTNQIALLTVIVLSGSHLTYATYVSAFILFQLPHAIYSVSVMTALLPAMSTKWSARDRAGFSSLLGLGLRSTVFIVIPAALGYIALAKPIVFATLRHAATTTPDARLVAGILVYFAVGLPFFSAFQLCARAWYGAQNTRAPALINVAATAINIAGNFLLFPRMGVEGLALAFSLSYVFAALFSLAVLRSWLPALNVQALAATTVRTLIAAAGSAILAYGTARAIGGPVSSSLLGQVAQVTVGVTVGGGTYVLLASALRIPEVDLLRRLNPLRTRRTDR
jgi:putative peptidoglycan lipid II flippase